MQLLEDLQNLKDLWTIEKFGPKSSKSSKSSMSTKLSKSSIFKIGILAFKKTALYVVFYVKCHFEVIVIF